MIQNNIKNILENPSLINLIFLFLAILGIVLAIYFYFKSKRNRIPKYAVRSINLIEDSIGKIGDVEISYAQNKIKNLSIARVAFWNDGSETISSGDVAPLNPIKICCSGTTDFLGIEIVYKKNLANNFSLSPITSSKEPTKHLQNELFINFDYIDKDEGIILQIFHTGKTGEEIQIQGSIKGGGSVKKLQNPLLNKMKPFYSYIDKLKIKHKKIILGIFAIITPVLFFIFTFTPILKIQTSLVIPKYISFFIITIMYWSLAFLIFHKRVPKGFDLFEEELIP
jgi:hypothetical protein